jgi:hypothetical protein
LDGRTIEPDHFGVLEDVLEIGKYNFTSFTLRGCCLNDDQIMRLAPMLESNTAIKMVRPCQAPN